MSLPKNATLSPKPFKIAIPQADIDDFKVLLRLSKLPPPTWEGSDEQFGVTNKWMKETKAYWESSFEWRKHEEEINKLPQYTVPIKNSDGNEYTIHFIGVFSQNPDAVPLILMHGWPGSFVEFLDIIPILAASTSPAFHVIIPSLPGYAFSSQPPLDKDFTKLDAAYLMNQLMVGLGFGESNGGYIAQGGDIGGILARLMQNHYPDCKGAHVNIFLNSTEHPTDNLDATDLIGLDRAKDFRTRGNAYGLMHATRPSTIGHVIASSPLALLAWIGEKLLQWSDERPPIEKILQLVTLWWLTDTFPRAIYPYRELFAPRERVYFIGFKKPLGYSLFPKELVPVPVNWVEAEAGELLIWSKRHEKGGHFAAMESPEVLAGDIKAFVEAFEKQGKSGA